MDNFLRIATFIGMVAGIIGVMFALTNEIKKRWLILFYSIGTTCYAILVYLFKDNPVLLTSLISVAVFFVLFSIYAYFMKKKIKEIKKEYSKIESQISSIPQRETKYKRFKDIKQDNVKYGYIVYKPFFWNEGRAPIRHTGIGYKVLEEVLSPLGIDITDNKNYHSSNWSHIFKELEDGIFDIIIIPLFETRSRLNKFNVTFCTPLFYSDIGLYAKNEQLPNTKFLFSEAIEFVKSKNWKGKHLENEISNSLMTKHKLQSIEIKPTVSRYNEDEHFQGIIDEINEGKTNFTFMEVFKAKTIIEKINAPAVINILNEKELLYPVSFVVRKEDTVLKNFINLRLMEMELVKDVDEYNGEETTKLKKIVKKAAVEGGILPEEFNDT